MSAALFFSFVIAIAGAVVAVGLCLLDRWQHAGRVTLTAFVAGGALFALFWAVYLAGWVLGRSWAGASSLSTTHFLAVAALAVIVGGVSLCSGRSALRTLAMAGGSGLCFAVVLSFLHGVR